VHSITRLNRGRWVGLPPRRAWATSPSRSWLISFISFPFYTETSSCTYFLVWGRGEQALITRLHCTCRAICAPSWGGQSTSGGSRRCWSELCGGGRAAGGRTQYSENVEIGWICGKYGTMKVWHRPPWCRDCWAFSTGFDPTGGVACHEGHNLQVGSLDTCSKYRHAARDDLGH